MKFPYGLTDFREIATGGYFYCDRTDRIPFLEEAKSQLFIRPRRFGKSLLLSMLEHYYDVARKEEFQEIFGGLAIGKNPTEHRNCFFVLRWDFSCVDASGSSNEIRQSLYNHINARIERLVSRYRSAGYPVEGVRLDRDDALASVESLLSATSAMGYPVYLLIDEYDNFANTIMMQGGNSRERYEELVHDQGILKTLFKAVKSATSSTGFDRVFITGVSPVVLSDITSGYNIAENIYFSRMVNDLCGFREKEVRQALEGLCRVCGHGPEMLDEGLLLARTYYDGYRFCRGKAENVYNPTLCLYFFKQIQEECEFPFEMLDANLAVDETKLEYVAQLPQGAETILTLSERGRDVAVESISKRFGLREMLFEDSKDRSFLLSYLYYFGVLTLSGMDEMGRFLLRVPNLVMQ
ncbi:MAG TPA: AAA family ATPase, partial [Desulfomicrobiaceae bacterium]|nr:AAA family ATPase [Desulfomicrobiaceae bacterium]